jgi:Mg-chelatase subunit ChlD
MILSQPVWLLLLLPLGLALRLWTPPSRGVLVLRMLVLLLVLLAMSGLAMKLNSRSGTLVVIADQSRSMPQDVRQRQKELLELLQSKMSKTDKMAVLSFGQNVSIQQAPQSGSFGGWTTRVKPDATNLSQALQLSLSLIPQKSSGRVLILSDGRWTGLDPARQVAQAAARKVALDYFTMQRSSVNDVAIDRIDAPRTVSPGDAFLLTAWVRLPVAQTIRYELRRDGVLLSAGTRKLNAGSSPLLFRDQSRTAGTHQYTLRILPKRKDPVPENNKATLLIGVKGSKPLLHLTRFPKRSGMAAMLKSGRIPVVSLHPRKMQWSLAALSRFSGVLLENVPAEDIGLMGMRLLKSWVKSTGSGLMITGGKNSFAPGGYYKTPLDPILPVSMELRREHRKLSLAISVVLDRSGSMSAMTPSGQTKMALANEGTAQVVKLLGALDEIGVLAVDSAPHVIVPMTRVKDKGALQSRIRSINSMGGGIYVYEGLKAAYAMLQNAQARTRHIILFADAADAEQPGAYKALLKRCKAENITVSVIGLGRDTDSDANFLKDVAKRGRGRVYFTTQADQLPRLFAQDTFVVARSTFIDEPTAFAMAPGMMTLASQTFAKPPALGGYNLTYLRPRASLAAVTQDKYKAPVVASWRVGLGRVLVYTGELDGKYTGNVGRWKQFGNWMGSMVRWTMGRNQKLPSYMMLQQSVKHGMQTVELLLDPEVKRRKLLSLPKVQVLQGIPGQSPKATKTKMRWVGPNRLQVQFPLRSGRVSLATVQLKGREPVTLSPVTLPYSPEFAPRKSTDSKTTLASLARATQGKERIQVSSIWAALPRTRRFLPLGQWLLLLALLLLLLEIWERRSGILTSLRVWTGRGVQERLEPVAVSTPSPAPTQKGTTSQALKQANRQTRQDSPPTSPSLSEGPSPSATSARKKPAKDEEEASSGSAFKRAAARARKRTGRD